MGKLKWLFEKWKKRPLLARLSALALLFLLFSVETRSFLTRPTGPEARLIAAKRALEPGAVLSIADLTVSYVPEAQSRPLGSFSDQEVQNLVGAIVTESVRTGELITRANIHLKLSSFAEKVPKGMRAFSIETEEVLPFAVGDRVDIQVVDPSNPADSNEVIESRKILGIQQNDNHQQVVVAVNTTEAMMLNAQKQKRKLHLILRNPQDDSESQRLKSSSSVRKKPKKIEIIEEGE
jgi:Flp pilus assembly protein CpaB